MTGAPDRDDDNPLALFLPGRGYMVWTADVRGWAARRKVRAIFAAVCALPGVTVSYTESRGFRSWGVWLCVTGDNGGATRAADLIENRLKES